MTCLFFGCDKPPIYGFKCCSKQHGWLLKGEIEQLKKYQNGEITWKFLWNDFDENPPTMEKMIYLNQLI